MKTNIYLKLCIILTKSFCIFEDMVKPPHEFMVRVVKEFENL